MRLKRKSENFIIIKIFINVSNNYKIIGNENLKTKIYKNKRNQKTYANELKI